MFTPYILHVHMYVHTYTHIYIKLENILEMKHWKAVYIHLMFVYIDVVYT